MADKMQTMKNQARPEIQREVEPSPISLQQVPLPGHVHEGNKGIGAGYIGQSQRSKERRGVSSASVSSLVRRLMATERARMLGRKAINPSRYTLEKRTRRWSSK
jgi:hypothetical protein